MSSLVPRALFQALRPHQWLKNGLVYVPVITSHRWGESEVVLHATVALLAFCLLASAAYLLNDLLDVEHDRAHPRKRGRPLASGALSRRAAVLAFVVVSMVGLAVAFVLPTEAALVLVAYFLLTTAYSAWLKRFELLDVLMLTILYNMRIVAGGAATGIILSDWLIMFSMFLFFAMATMKRVTEVRNLQESNLNAVAGRGYRVGDDQFLVPLGIACSVASAVILGLYAGGEDVAALYTEPTMLLFLVPLCLVWQSALWLLTLRDQMHDDPLVYAVRAPLTWVVLVAAAILIAVAR